MLGLRGEFSCAALWWHWLLLILRIEMFTASGLGFWVVIEELQGIFFGIVVGRLAAGRAGSNAEHKIAV